MTTDALLVSDRLSARDRALVALAAAGLTPREISRLTLGDVRIFPSMGLVKLRPERCARCVRYARLDLAAASAVLRYLSDESARDGRAPLFTGGQGGRPLSDRWVRWLLAQLREASA